MRIATKISFALLLLSFGKLSGQDIHFSQFAQSALNINPANAGFFDADLRLGALHRRQWASVTVPYKTFSVAADAKLNMFLPVLSGFGAGILINHDETGDGQLRTLDVRAMFSYRHPLNSDSIHFIRVGLLSGFSQRTIDFNKLTFDNQFNGDSWDPQAPSGENYSGNKVNWFDVGIGIGWDMMNENSRYSLGISSTHLNRPNQSFMTETVRRPVLWQLNYESIHKINDQFSLLPSMIYMHQQEFREFNLGAELKILLQNEKQQHAAAGLGIYSRWNDAIIPTVAIYWSKFRFGFSYDINISTLNTVSRGMGGPEFSIVYMTKKISAHPQRSVVCPVY